MNRWIPVVVALSALTACRSDGRTLDPPVFPPPDTTTTTVLPPDPVMTEPEAIAGPLQLIAPWQDGAEIPLRYTCDAENLSPPLSWTNLPAGTVELAVTVTDLDAPQYVHWVVLGISVDTMVLAEGVPPQGAVLWKNGSGSTDYTGPCPPPGQEHRYLFTVHALNQQLEPADGMEAVEVIDLLNLVSIDQSSISGVFARGG